VPRRFNGFAIFLPFFPVLALIDAPCSARIGISWIPLSRASSLLDWRRAGNRWPTWHRVGYNHQQAFRLSSRLSDGLYSSDMRQPGFNPNAVP
jgi:hypothetical protein